jgi:voltage-gated potassium channel
MYIRNPSPRNLGRRRGDLSEHQRLKRRLGMAMAALAAVIAIGTVGFAIIGAGAHDVIDAFYMTIITLTTVGFGEIIDMSSNPAGRIFTVIILLSGMGIVAYSIPLVTAFIIEGQLFQTFARRRMEKKIARLKGHHIVAGDDATACYVAEEFVRTGRSVVLVLPAADNSPCQSEELAEVPRIIGDATDDATLLEANLPAASGVVACMESDKDNQLVVLTARRLSSQVRIVAATERTESEAKLRVAGADAVVWTSRIGGLRMASEMVRPKVVSFLDRMLRDTQMGLRVEEVVVPEDYDAGDKTIATLKIDDVHGVMLLATQAPGQEEFEFKPSPNKRLEPGMTLIVMAEADGRAKLEKKLTKRRTTRVTTSSAN